MHFVFIFAFRSLLLQPEDQSQDVADGQMLPSSCIPAVCLPPSLAPSQSPALSKDVFERGSMELPKRKGLVMGAWAAPLWSRSGMLHLCKRDMWA